MRMNQFGFQLLLQHFSSDFFFLIKNIICKYIYPWKWNVTVVRKYLWATAKYYLIISYKAKLYIIIWSAAYTQDFNLIPIYFLSYFLLKRKSTKQQSHLPPLFPLVWTRLCIWFYFFCIVPHILIWLILTVDWKNVDSIDHRC